MINLIFNIISENFKQKIYQALPGVLFLLFKILKELIIRTLVKELKEKVSQEVMLYLTLDVLRDQKHLQFILAHDKSGSIQLIVSKKFVVNHGEIGTLLQGSTFIAKGKLVMAEQSRFGMELQVESIEVLTKA